MTPFLGFLFIGSLDESVHEFSIPVSVQTSFDRYPSILWGPLLPFLISLSSTVSLVVLLNPEVLILRRYRIRTNLVSNTLTLPSVQSIEELTRH